MNLLDATEDPALFAPWFRDRSTWSAWFAFIAALFGLQMTGQQTETYRQHTGRTEAPTKPALLRLKPPSALTHKASGPRRALRSSFASA